MSEQRDVWVTKYWATRAIVHLRDATMVTERGDAAPKYASKLGSWWLRLGRDAFLSEEEALSAVEDLRKKKILSLQKQLKRLEDLVVRVVEEP